VGLSATPTNKSWRNSTTQNDNVGGIVFLRH
jgi:hypothetical protein